MLQPRDALTQRAVVGRLGDAEEVVVVAALLARILDDEGVIGRVDRGEGDAANILIQAVFERADAVLDLVRGLACCSRRGNVSRGAQQIVERDHAAAV